MRETMHDLSSKNGLVQRSIVIHERVLERICEHGIE